ncbi:uncharacterized protein LOC108511131 [Phoenix dactylifera]|uniref:Uncharacterized protein LOC108511131 n=1 Tax=Phoenix dactylifera TaxID=42345 RepID=A0A8B7MT60_PHODC|nr:uncharacterized protein LOC108511131 [Phoenix dactylifera]
MITRSKLVEQLRDYQIRSQHKWVALFNPISPPDGVKLIAASGYSMSGNSSESAASLTLRDIIGALSCGLLLCFLVISSYVTLYFRYFRLSAVIICLGILLPVCLQVCRQRKLAKKRERRLLLPLSM